MPGTLRHERKRIVEIDGIKKTGSSAQMTRLMQIDRNRVFRYLLTGGVAWVVDVIVFALCLSDFGVVIAQLFARTAGAIVGFFGHKLFVFREPDVAPSTLATQGIRYVALWVLSYTVSTLALVGLIEYCGTHALASKLMVECAIVVMNYMIMKTLIFEQPAANREGK